MVNLKNWEVVEHEDIKLGDDLKIVWIKTVEGLKTTEVHTGKVRSTFANGTFYVNGVGWVPGPAFDGTSTTLHRRIPKTYTFPTGKAALIEGKGTSGSTIQLIHLGNGRWYSLANHGTYTTDKVRVSLKDLRTLSEGV